jgi:hypothetical protein
MINTGNGPAPKAGYNSTGSYGNDMQGDNFGIASYMDTTSGGVGRTYQSMSESDIPPMSQFRNTATGVIYPAYRVGPAAGTLVATQARDKGMNVPIVQPHERGKFFGHRARPLVRRAGGAGAPSSQDTLRHPNPKDWTPSLPVIRSAKAGERTNEASFISDKTLVSDPNQSNYQQGRWSTVKRGAAG